MSVNDSKFVRHIVQRFAMGVALLFAFHGVSSAQETGGSEVVGGMIAYYGVVPSQLVGAHPPGHPEARMHGGVPSGKRSHHVIVALFDQESFERITDATVSATVAEVGLAGQTKPLEPFTVDDALTYGNYFDLTPRTLYRITVSVRAPGKAAEAKFRFDFKHQ